MILAVNGIGARCHNVHNEEYRWPFLTRLFDISVLQYPTGLVSSKCEMHGNIGRLVLSRPWSLRAQDWNTPLCVPIDEIVICFSPNIIVFGVRPFLRSRITENLYLTWPVWNRYAVWLFQQCIVSLPPTSDWNPRILPAWPMSTPTKFTWAFTEFQWGKFWSDSADTWSPKVKCRNCLQVQQLKISTSLHMTATTCPSK